MRFLGVVIGVIEITHVERLAAHIARAHVGLAHGGVIAHRDFDRVAHANTVQTNAARTIRNAPLTAIGVQTDTVEGWDMKRSMHLRRERYAVSQPLTPE